MSILKSNGDEKAGCETDDSMLYKSKYLLVLVLQEL